MGLLNQFEEKQSVEETSLNTKRNAAHERSMEQIIDVYSHWRTMESAKYQWLPDLEEDLFPLLETITYTPHAITDFVSEYLPIHPFENAGNFVNALIQHAFLNGQSSFTIRTQDLNNGLENMRDGIGQYVKGYKSRPLQLKLIGDAGWRCGYDVTHCHIEVTGDVGTEFGEDALFSSFIVHGNATEYSFSNIDNSKVVINGMSGECVAHSVRYSDVTFNGIVDLECGGGARNSKIRYMNAQIIPEYLGANSINTRFYSPSRELLESIHSEIVEDNQRKRNRPRDSGCTFYKVGKNRARRIDF